MITHKQIETLAFGCTKKETLATLAKTMARCKTMTAQQIINEA